MRKALRATTHLKAFSVRLLSKYLNASSRLRDKCNYYFLKYKYFFLYI